MRFKILLYTCFAFFSFPSVAQVQLMDKAQLLQLFEPKNDDTVRVINFWATWCKPCVKEIPYFKQAYDQISNPKKEFIFVSFDMKKSKENVEKFIQKNEMPGENYLLTETDFDSFINQIDSTWSGSIPYTTLLNQQQRKNHEGDFENTEELINFITQKNTKP